MTNLDPKVNEIRNMYKRVYSVIESCENIDQLQTARKYANLAIDQCRSNIPTRTTYERHQLFLARTTMYIDKFFEVKEELLMFNPDYNYGKKTK